MSGALFYLNPCTLCMQSQAELDAELEGYMLKDPEQGKTYLDTDLENYMKGKGSKPAAEDAEAEAAAEEAPAAE